MIAVGTKAREMYEKGNANIRTIRPLREESSQTSMPLST